MTLAPGDSLGPYRIPGTPGAGGMGYDVAVDGNRFLLKVPVHDATSTPIHIVTSRLAGRSAAGRP